jgi:DNA-directed RNA polymerase specialized sigma24 family protein
MDIDDVPIASGEDSPETLLAKREFARRLAAAIKKLGEPCRTIFYHKARGSATEEIQAAIGASSPNAVLIQVSRCRKRLAAEMAPWGRL